MTEKTKRVENAETVKVKSCNSDGQHNEITKNTLEQNTVLSATPWPRRGARMSDKMTTGGTPPRRPSSTRLGGTYLKLGLEAASEHPRLLATRFERFTVIAIRP